MDAVHDNEFCRTVKWIIREKFAIPLRQSHNVHPDFAFLLKDSLQHLCSGTLGNFFNTNIKTQIRVSVIHNFTHADVEELLTILFEFTYKMSPFINYSLDMVNVKPNKKHAKKIINQNNLFLV